MICTTKEAKNRWCPEVRLAGLSKNKINIYPAHNRWQNPDKETIWQECCCLAADCVAWCWHDKRAGMGYCGKVGKGRNVPIKRDR